MPTRLLKLALALLTASPVACPAVSGSAASAAAQNPSASHRELTVDDYDFTAPEGWLVQRLPDHVLLAQTADGTGCTIQILPPQPSSGNLEQEAQAVFATMYAGWQQQQSGERQYELSRGHLPTGLAYVMMAAPMSATTADGRYHLEDGAALVLQAGDRIAIVAVRHRGLFAHNDCLRRYPTWRRFFNTFGVRGIAPARDTGEPAQRIVGVWSQTESGATGEWIFAANGRYSLVGALGSSSTHADERYEYLQIRTSAFRGEGRYTLRDGQLILQRDGNSPAEERRFRFEQVNHGGTGWRDRLWLLTVGVGGKFEVAYERQRE